MSTRDEYVTKLKGELDEFNAQLDGLEKKAAEAKSDAKEAYEKQLADMRQKSKDVSAKIDEVKAAGETGWEKLAAETDHVLTTFKKSYNYFKSQI